MIAQELNVPIRRCCALLDIAPASFYRWCRRGEIVDALLDVRERIRALHQRWYGLQGYRRMHQNLRLDGIEVTERAVRRIMKEKGLSGRPSGRKAKYSGRSGEAVADDRLQRQFHADAPNTKWVSDITEFRTTDGKAFLCVVKDLYDGMIVGWSIARRAPRHLVLRALAMAKAQRGTIAGEFIFHSDRGTQYTSAEVTAWLAANGGVPSMGARGTSADNASAESFFGVMKRDIIHVVRNTPYDEAVARINDYILNLHNRNRRRSTRRVAPEGPQDAPIDRSRYAHRPATKQ